MSSCSNDDLFVFDTCFIMEDTGTDCDNGDNVDDIELVTDVDDAEVCSVAYAGNISRTLVSMTYLLYLPILHLLSPILLYNLGLILT